MMRLACSTLKQYAFEEKPQKSAFGALSKSLSKTLSKSESKGSSLGPDNSSFTEHKAYSVEKTLSMEKMANVSNDAQGIKSAPPVVLTSKDLYTGVYVGTPFSAMTIRLRRALTPLS